MMLSHLYESAPGLEAALKNHTLLAEEATIWPLLRRFLLAHAPSGGAALPGAIGDTLAAVANDLELGDRYMSRIGSTGNTGLWLGANKAAADLVIVAHMDRPTFKVRSETDGILYPICANRFPSGRYEVAAKALRFDSGELKAGARGRLISDRQGGNDHLRFEATEGALCWRDLITMDVEPVLDGSTIRGTGLDNCLGVMTALGTAAILRAIEPALIAANKRCLFVFSDQEEGNPESFFGHGAARLAHALPPPAIGCIVVDAQSTGDETNVTIGHGAAHGSVSAWGRGSVVPPNALALAADLAAEVNAAHPDTVQLNTGYLSRSDDVALARWAQVLAMIGPPMSNAHTGDESASLADLPRSIRWLAHFVAAAIGLSDEIRQQYQL